MASKRRERPCGQIVRVEGGAVACVIEVHGVSLPTKLRRRALKRARIPLVPGERFLIRFGRRGRMIFSKDTSEILTPENKKDLRELIRKTKEALKSREADPSSGEWV